MNVYVINRLGKKIFVRALLKGSEAPGVVNDLILELHARLPQKTKDAISVIALADDDAEWLERPGHKGRIRLSNLLGWEFDLKRYDSSNDIVLELNALN